VLFNLVVKHSPDKRKATRGGKNRRKIQGLNRHSKKNYPPHTRAFITWTMSTRTNKGAKNLKVGYLLFCLVVFIVHASIFCPHFSQKQSAKWQKNTGECFTTKLRSTCKNSGTFEEKKNFSQKRHLR